MVNVMKCYISMLHKLMKSIGMHPIDVEIEPGTVIHFWVNNNKEKNNKNKDGRKKKKPSLVLIQGFAGTGILTWQFQVLALRKKYTLYIPDLIFFGGSYTNKTDRTPRFQADCFAIGLKKLGVEEKCVVVGFSYGGFVGFQMAEHHPDLVGLLVVTGSVVAVSESIYKDTLKRIGFSNFVDFLLPITAEGVEVLLKIGSYKFPWMPDLFRKHLLEVEIFIGEFERVMNRAYT
ncbi:uncharacterized protein LOC130822892 [Amaranthus tricolor]|uniref:uncharacterized protein LOC130822892 n=1 Tax=Amaranthus tricolor TaxID=29722 RepID=UPI00258B1219|nr:uncharacterized protein LOC130822892 [Amaranthus tricolor]